MECAFTSPVRSECAMFVRYCMQCCMSVSAVVVPRMCCLEEVYTCLKLFNLRALFRTYPNRSVRLRHIRVGAQFIDMPGSNIIMVYFV